MCWEFLDSLLLTIHCPSALLACLSGFSMFKWSSFFILSPRMGTSFVKHKSTKYEPLCKKNYFYMMLLSMHTCKLRVPRSPIWPTKEREKKKVKELVKWKLGCVLLQKLNLMSILFLLLCIYLEGLFFIYKIHISHFASGKTPFPWYLSHTLSLG